MKIHIKNLPMVILSGITVILAAAVIGLLLFLKNQPAPVRGFPAITALAAMEPDISKWGVNFPNEYTSFLQTRADPGEAESKDYLAADPKLIELFAGYPFSKEYNAPRGHLNSLTDVRATKRINDKSPGTCYSCKSSQNPQLWATMGMAAFDKTLFKDLTPQIHEPIGCANCHEAKTMRLIVTNPALETALQSQGKDWRTFTRQEMRSLVCANCHVEYYFAGDGKLLTLPWKYGTTVENFQQYYTEINFSDWTHADSGAAMVKMQHPDYELYTAGSTHYKAGVSCADCHMPYLRDGAAKYSSHNITSPLDNPAASCGACHTDVNYVVDRVKAIQQQVQETKDTTEAALVDAIKAISTAATAPGVDGQLLQDARNTHRNAQLRWDYVAAANSLGFHNPEEALRILASATDLARQAQLKAVQAVPVKAGN